MFVALLLAAALAGGCGNSASSTKPGGGDTGGTHLVVYTSDRGNTAGQFDIYLYDLDALGFRLIANINSSTAPDRHPSISSDGLVIAFQSDRGTGSGSDILLYSRALQQLIALPGVNTTSDETEPAFTGDAVKLAFTRTVAGVRRVHMVDGFGDTLVALPGLDTTSTAFSDWAPSPNQTGSRIAFVSDRNGNPDIFVWDAATRSLLDLPNLNSPGNDVDPSITPDGRYLCFASDRAGGLGGYDLYLYDLLGKVFITLPTNANPLFATNTSADERHPAISVTGDVIVFESTRTGSGKIDLWNCRRSSSSVGQGAQESSASDDIEPSLLYP
jgi:Tol biopolymer transport system component